jgi:TPR repeat protein
VLLAKAQAGNMAAEYQVGLEYDKGKEVSQDFDMAAMWYQKAAEQGDAGAEVNLGLLYGRGEGVPRDEAQANVWFRKAAEQGNATAQFDLGISYRDGKGVPQDYTQSAMWFRKAAEQGDARAKADLDKIQSEILSENKGSNSLSYWPNTIRVDTDMDSSWLIDEERTCQTYPNDKGRIAVVNCNQSGSHRDHNIPVTFWGDPDRNISSDWKCRREKSIFSDTFVCGAID